MSNAVHMDAQPYFLPAHVYTCAVQDQVFFLDLRRNRYLATTLDELQGLSGLVRRWPAGLERAPGGGTFKRTEAESRATIAELSGHRLLLPATEDLGNSDVLAQPSHPTVGRALFERALERYPVISARHLARFLRAAAIAKYRLSACSLYSTVLRIQWRRARHPDPRLRDGLSALQSLVAVFHRLRPLLLPTRVPCLANSIALLEFLASYGHFPRLVFGVQAHPFSAHCWVQHADVVLNAPLENVLGYTPILVA